jgi:lipoprotein-anchoring transpeptidase ErfK/SrfK
MLKPSRFSSAMPEPVAAIDVSRQTLSLTDATGQLHRYPVSTSRYGTGERNGSLQTPRGLHQIRALIGAGCPSGTVFVGRRATGEIWSEALALANPERDWILTRILWLSGLEPGVNRLGKVDTMRRYIYIHGMPDSEPCGTPGSIGCIRMRNADIVDLFERVDAGTRVLIG